MEDQEYQEINNANENKKRYQEGVEDEREKFK